MESADKLNIAPRKQRISEIAQETVSGMVANGTLDPNNEAAMDAACRQAVEAGLALLVFHETLSPVKHLYTP